MHSVTMPLQQRAASFCTARLTPGMCARYCAPYPPGGGPLRVVALLGRTAALVVSASGAGLMVVVVVVLGVQG